MMAHLAANAWAAGAVALLVMAAWGLGGCFQRWLSDAADLLDSERAALRFLAGSGSLGLVVFLTGQLYFSGWSSVAILAGAALLNLRFPWQGRRRASPSFGLLFTGIVVLLCVLSGFARPIGDTDADEITYHLLGPPIWLREHRIAPVPEEALTAFPATMEMLYSVAKAIANDRAPGAFGALFLGVLALQTRGLARRLGGSVLAGDLAAAFLAGMPAVTSTTENCFVDLPYAAFTLASARLVFDASQPRRVILAGIFAGFACGTKYFGLPATLLIAVLLVVFHTGKIVPRLRHALLFLVASGIAGGAWYVRNWIVLGNPVYPPPPLLWHWFPTPTFSLESSLHFKAYITQRGAGLGKNIGDLLLLPVRLTYWTAWFHGGGGMGLAPLAFGPVGLALLWKKRVALAWAALATMLTVFWFYSDQEFRFLDPAVAIFAAFAGLGAAALLRQPGRFSRWSTYAAIGISLAVGVAHAYTFRGGRLRSVFSPSAAEVRYREGVPYFGAFAYLNSRDEVKKVFVCHPYAPVYYLRMPYTLALGRFGEQPHPHIRSVADAIGAVRELGITHVLDVNYFDSGYAWPEAGHGRLVFEGKNVRIYSIEDANGAP